MEPPHLKEYGYWIGQYILSANKRLVVTANYFGSATGASPISNRPQATRQPSKTRCLYRLDKMWFLYSYFSPYDPWLYFKFPDHWLGCQHPLQLHKQVVNAIYFHTLTYSIYFNTIRTFWLLMISETKTKQIQSLCNTSTILL